MRKTTFFCDKCGRQVTDTIFQIGFRTIDVLTGEQIEEEFNAEFCRDCYKEIDDAVAVAVMSHGKKPEVDTTATAVKADEILAGVLPKDPTPEPKKRTAPNRAKLDMPKVHALINAGWSYDKIGVEFGVSGQTISNRLKEEKEALE